MFPSLLTNLANMSSTPSSVSLYACHWPWSPCTSGKPVQRRRLGQDAEAALQLLAGDRLSRGKAAGTGKGRGACGGSCGDISEERADTVILAPRDGVAYLYWPWSTVNSRVAVLGPGRASGRASCWPAQVGGLGLEASGELWRKINGSLSRQNHATEVRAVEVRIGD